MAVDPVHEAKAALRRAVRDRLRRLTDAAWADAGERVSALLLGVPAWSEARAVMGYAGMPGEVDPRAALAEALGAGKVVCLPGVNWEESTLTPRRVTGFAEVVQDGRGVPGPAPACPAVDAATLDVVLVPGVAFDGMGGRLGRGGGFYDRFLAAESRRYTVIGVCHSWQVVDAVPMAAHDARVDVVVTELGVTPVRGVG